MYTTSVGSDSQMWKPISKSSESTPPGSLLQKITCNVAGECGGRIISQSSYGNAMACTARLRALTVRERA
jgi:hypothetical protein